MQKSYVYIITNIRKTMYYIGVTNNLERRLEEHIEGTGSIFTSKYNIHYLVYFEEFTTINWAIEREKQLKGWSRIK
ncbi:MAG: GIY-YIG nuclease family protein, partial [Flavobacteriales bacterium]|nr:GIY-YIG nuclease family protein [Flavobacteriales bacterium]